MGGLYETVGLVGLDEKDGLDGLDEKACLNGLEVMVSLLDWLEDLGRSS